MSIHGSHCRNSEDRQITFDETDLTVRESGDYASFPESACQRKIVRSVNELLTNLVRSNDESSKTITYFLYPSRTARSAMRDKISFMEEIKLFTGSIV